MVRDAESPAPLPDALRAICVIALVVSAFALFAAPLGFLEDETGLSTAFRGFYERGLHGSALETQRALVAELRMLVFTWRPWLVSIRWANVGLAALLVPGAVLVLRRRPSGRRLLLTGLLVGVVIELASVPPTWAIQRGTMSILDRMTADVLGTMPPGATGSARMIVTTMRLSMVTGLIVAAAIMAVKLVYYAFAGWYLGRKYPPSDA